MVNEKPDSGKKSEQKPANEGSKTKKDKKEQEEELSEEDQQLKSDLDLSVERLQENNAQLHRSALEQLRTTIRTATSSMTSVPKPLKFLSAHYASLKDVYETWPESSDKQLFADILSVLSMTYADEGKRDCLIYRLKGSKEVEIDLWGHEYVRHLAMEIGKEYEHRVIEEEPTDELRELTSAIIPFFLRHNAETDAVDLLDEIESIELLPRFVSADTFERVCLYMLALIPLLGPPKDVNFMETCRAIYRQQGKYAQSLTLSIRLGNMDHINEDFNTCPDPILKKQMAYQLARQRIYIETEDEELKNRLSNAYLSKHFKAFAKELDVLAPKVPEDVYKSHLENQNTSTGYADSALTNLTSALTNGFVNAGFSSDKLIMEDETNAWIYNKTKEHGTISVIASLGLIHLWDLDEGLDILDKYMNMHPNDDNAKAGALLGIGVLCSGVHDENDPALALLDEYINEGNLQVKCCATFGLGLAYAGSANEGVKERLIGKFDDHLTMQEYSLAALALGMVFVGTADDEIGTAILQKMMEKMEDDEKDLSDKWARYMGLGLALLHNGKQEESDATLETLKAISHPLGKQTGVLVQALSFAGTGNVLKVQEMLHTCIDHLDKKEDDLHQAFATIGIALIAMGEDIGTQMSVRNFNHLMHHSESTIRKAVPLALSLLYVSNPELNILDLLSKYSHDNDREVAISAIFAMGIVGSGTNNARLAQMLRQLASFYYKEKDCLSIVRLAQGLLHMAKGTMTLSPFHTDRQVMSPVALAGLLTSIMAFTDSKNFVSDIKQHHYLLFSLVTAMYPRFLITIDANDEFEKSDESDDSKTPKHLPVDVRVGQAVDVAGQAGRPKTITGFQTHKTPVLLAHSERAELATEKYISVAPVLEGIVLLRENPEYMEEDKE